MTDHDQQAPGVGRKWLAAALLGSLWAAIEIILGSFLHLSGSWFSGTILAGFGVALMAAATQVWPWKGVLWRAGLICALMKSVSPSAVIIGPMVGIALEAFIMEASTRLLGRNLIGILIGGAVATALPIIQRIAGIVVVYGFDVARLYVALYETAARALHLEGIDALDLVLAWLAMNLLLGAGAALIGMRAGAHARHLPDPPPVPLKEGSVFSLGDPDPGQIFSCGLLLTHAALMPIGFIAIGSWPILFSAPAIAVYAALTFLLYPRIRRRFSRPRPWIEFVAISVLAGFILGGVTGAEGFRGSEGLQIGAEMALRAIFVVVAFSAISIELRNPVIVQWFLRRGLSPLSSALDVAFQALPAMMQAIGEERRFFRHPLRSVSRVIAVARGWLSRFEQEGPSVIAFLTGEQGTGKTSFAESLVDLVKARGGHVAGILAPVLIENAGRAGYRIRDLATGRELELCRRVSDPTHADVGRFAFHADGVAFGEEALRIGEEGYPDLVILDEVGPLELAGKGWADALTRLRKAPVPALVIIVRPAVLREVSERWNFAPDAVWKAGSDDPAAAARWLLRRIAPGNP